MSSTTRLALPVAAVVALAVLIGTGVWLATDRDTGDGHARTEAHTSDNGHHIDKTAPSATSQDPTGAVVLPKGAETVNGWPVKFPATDLGAVSAQVAVARAQLGFDYAQAERIAQVYADPESVTVFTERSAAAVQARRAQAGLPATGEVSAPASYAVTPLAYQLVELGPDYYAVHLLSYITLTTVKGETANHLYAGTQLVHWIEGDWKLAEASPEELAQLKQAGTPAPAKPGTPKFNQAGWVAIAGETS